MSRLLLCTGFSATVLSLFGSFYYVTVYKPRQDKKRLRDKLPNSIWTWRRPSLLPAPLQEEELWQALTDTFREVGLVPWKYRRDSEIVSPRKFVSANGFSYVSPRRGIEGRSPGAAVWLRVFDYMNPLTRASETKDGQPVMVRVMSIGDEGYEYLSIIRKTSTGPVTLLSNNHCLPLYKEFNFEDIIFGVFPKTGGCFDEAWDAWAKNSLGDLLDMMLQILEGVVFLHGMNIAHRDLFNTNILVDWHPESLLSKEVSVSKPRVHIIDFEFAVEFPSECLPNERVCTGNPCPRWYPTNVYTRPSPPEMSNGKPYCPFKLDIWQLGYTFTSTSLKTNIHDIDELFSTMKSSNPEARPTADEAFKKLRESVYRIPPESLLVPPDFIKK